MNKIVWLLGPALLALMALSAPAQQEIDLSGTWVGTTEVPDVGTDEVTLVLEKTEAGYRGTLSDSLSVVAPDCEIADMVLDGDALSFSFSLADGTPMVMRLTVSGEVLSGQWEHPEGAIGTIELIRKT